ncbi:thymidine kinase [Candidatus Marinimicrobia bacterium]|jgi:thymidine kinase|nr:thymidine kinase [Candidatus Neomarinimicrobiota bacterium]
MNNKNYNSNSIEVICGPMFSGKTEELIRRLIRAQIAKKNVYIFKHSTDNRYSEDYIVSHNKNKIKCHSIADPQQILKFSQDIDIIGIDEAQFFDMSIIDICNKLANEGKRIIIAGLDRDYKAIPFGPMANLLAHADNITKLNAICMVCGNNATFSQRLIDDEQQIVIGESDQYEARCRNCYKH